MASIPLGMQRTAVDTAQGLAALLSSIVTPTFRYTLVTSSGPPAVFDPHLSYVDITMDTQAARWTDDGTAPTTTHGTPLASGATVRITRNQFVNFQIIGATTGGFANAAAYKTG